ncbi:predicted protein [Lichtheimia corymbifera JMRC:FSU:9682]|uniref:Uncharacterized protein n=1 Tax=Lichtheimia corymbifera JMRC:FSU:9682 TaxID=1263082 RepID=A0A068SGB6_9FUNG|nr:predicted protein [Lichtheimia corymbifera JMRC:FSU:9682]
MTKKGLTSSGWEREHTSSDHMALLNQHIGYDGGIQSSAVMRIVVITWRVVSRNNGSCHVDTAEDDDGPVWIDEMYYILPKGAFTALDAIGILKSMRAAAILQSWMKDAYDGSNQEYNDTVFPVDSM